MPDTADDAEQPALDRTLTDVTSEVVASYVARNAVPPIDVPALITTVHATFADLGKAPHPAAEPQKRVPAVPVRKSITDEHLVSLEDGRPYKALKRHLTKLGLTPAEYRANWGLPADYPMVAPAYSRARSEQAKNMGLGDRLRRKR